MFKSKSVRKFLKNNSAVVLVAGVLVFIAIALSIQSSKLWPLQGQAYPQYGGMPVPNTTLRRAAPKKPGQIEMRRQWRLQRYYY